MHLSTDSNVKLQTHTDELFARIGILIFLWLIISIPWLINIDYVLNYFIVKLDPCNVNCINLYQPEKWSEIRYISAGVMGFATILPIICQQFWVFTKPGLTSSERFLVKLSLAVAPVTILLVVYLTMLILMPKLFSFGHEIQTEYGLIAKYDVISLLNFAIAIIWLEIIIIIAATIMVASGLTNNLDSTNANWWRTRIYGFMSLIIILSFYEWQISGLMLALTSIIIVELLSSPWIKKEPKFHVKVTEIFNADGEISRQCSLACDCHHKIATQFLDEKNIIEIPSLCADKKSQNELRVQISHSRPNKLIVHNCHVDRIFWQELANNFPKLAIVFYNDSSTNKPSIET